MPGAPKRARSALPFSIGSALRCLAKLAARLAPWAVAGLGLATARAQDEPLQIREFRFPHELEVVFALEGVDPAEAQIFLLRADALESEEADWEIVEDAVIESLSPGRYRVSLGEPFGEGFFRIVAFYDAGEATAEFASTSFSVVEGDSEGYIRIVFNTPYTGTISYVVEGNALPGEYEALPGALELDQAIEARIPIRIADDATFGGARHLSISLEPVEGLRLGAASQATVVFEDNDATWLGALAWDELEAGIRLDVTDEGGSRSAALTSDGSGLFPAGAYPVSLDWSADSFEAEVAGIEVAAGDTFLGEGPTITILLSAANGVQGQLVEESQLQGLASVQTQYANATHLNSVSVFQFYLNEKPTPLTERDVVLTDE